MNTVVVDEYHDDDDDDDGDGNNYGDICSSYVDMMCLLSGKCNFHRPRYYECK